MNENEASQLDEIQVLFSMYSTEELKPRVGMDRCWSIPIHFEEDEDDLMDALIFEFWFHRSYPSDSAPFFEFRGAKNWINLPFHTYKQSGYSSTVLEEQGNVDKLTIKEVIQLELKALFCCGVPVAFQWIEFLRNEVPNQLLDIPLILSELRNSVEKSPVTRDSKVSALSHQIVSNEKRMDIIHGESFTEKKSKFIAHVAKVTSLEDVQNMLSQLLEDDKIANATHNILAYRIRQGDQILENRDDDGETGAADQILYLMQISNAENVCCIVTRWFGGVKLGADRFRVSTYEYFVTCFGKIITGVAKKVLQDNGYIATKK